MRKHVPLYENYFENDADWQHIKEFLGQGLVPTQSVYFVGPVDEDTFEFALVLDYSSMNKILGIGGLAKSLDEHTLVHIGLVPFETDNILHHLQKEYHVDLGGVNVLREDYQEIYELIEMYKEPEAWDDVYGDFRRKLKQKYDPELAESILSIFRGGKPN